MSDPIVNGAFLLVGWALGLFSPLLSDRIKRGYERAELRRGLIAELGEARIRLAGSTFIVNRRFGVVDRAFLVWAVAAHEGYSGGHPAAKIAERLGAQLDLSDDQLAALDAAGKAAPSGALSLKKFSLPYVEARLGRLDWLDPLERNHVLEIRARVDMLNEEIDESRYYFQLTFDASISEENRDLIGQSLRRTYLNYAESARATVDRIRDVEVIMQGRLSGI